MRVIRSFAIASLLLAATATAGNAEGNPGANRDYIQAVQAFCSSIVGTGAFETLNFGECMSFNVVSLEGFRTHFCDALREGALGTLEDYGFDSYSDCVQNLEL